MSGQSSEMKLARTLITCAFSILFCFKHSSFFFNASKKPMIDLVCMTHASPQSPFLVALEGPGRQHGAGPHGLLLGSGRMKEWRRHYLYPSPESQPRQRNEVGLGILQLRFCILYKHSLPSPSSSSPGDRTALSKHPDARALASVHGSPVSPGQVISSRVTQFSNLSSRVT